MSATPTGRTPHWLPSWRPNHETATWDALSGAVALFVGPKLLYVCPMRCTFDLDGEPRASWTQERQDLPLYVGNEVTHQGSAYAIVDGPHYVADWESASISATFVVKAAPTSRR
jgi:hypothetical protein